MIPIEVNQRLKQMKKKLAIDAFLRMHGYDLREILGVDVNDSALLFRALNKEEALKMIVFYRELEVAIVGGEVYYLNNLGEIGPTCDNWSCNGIKGESSIDYLDRSIHQAICFVENFHNKFYQNCIFLFDIQVFSSFSVLESEKIFAINAFLRVHGYDLTEPVGVNLNGPMAVRRALTKEETLKAIKFYRELEVQILGIDVYYLDSLEDISTTCDEWYCNRKLEREKYIAYLDRSTCEAEHYIESYQNEFYKNCTFLFEVICDSYTDFIY